MSVKTHDIDIVYRKLELEIEQTHHRIGWFVHNGKRILKTWRSHGRGDVPMFVFHKIRSQLKVNESEMAGLIDCKVNRAGYVEILRKKGALGDAV